MAEVVQKIDNLFMGLLKFNGFHHGPLYHCSGTIC